MQYFLAHEEIPTRTFPFFLVKRIKNEYIKYLNHEFTILFPKKLMVVPALVVSVVFSLVGLIATYSIIPLVSDLFIKKGVSGKDLLKVKAPIV